MDQDNNLVEGCKAGDRQAQIDLYRKYYHQVYNTCLRLVCNSADAEDLMQNSFIDALGKIKTYKGVGSFAGWLRKIAVNNCLDYLAKRKLTDSLPETMPEIPDQSDDEESAYIEFRVEQIKKAMSNIIDDYRIILSFYLFEGYDHEEIGQILSISQQNVRTRISRAKHALIRQISRENNVVSTLSNNERKYK